MRIEHELLIDAPVDTVWALTVDVERWPDITPTMTTVTRLDDRPFGVGGEARVKQPGQRTRVWTVTRFEAPHHFEWDATMGPIRMRGGHHLQAEGDQCRNRLSLELTGFASGLFGRLARRALRSAITRENEGFKAAAEVAATPPERR